MSDCKIRIGKARGLEGPYKRNMRLYAMYLLTVSSDSFD